MYTFKKERKIFRNTCSICGKTFESFYQNKMVCSFDCRQEKKRECALRLSRIKKNNKKIYEPCEICGFDLYTELHHDTDGKHILCPNHHTLITKNIKTLKDLKSL